MTKGKLELLLKFHLRASHTLEERETAHEHIWRITAAFTGPLTEGRIVSLPALRELLQPAVTALEGTYLNENALLDPESRAFPTCEYFTFYFEREFTRRIQEAGYEKVRLTELLIAVDELSGEETGAARLTF